MRIAMLLGTFPVISETFVLRQITGLIASRAAKTSTPLVTQPSSCPEPTNHTDFL